MDLMSEDLSEERLQSDSALIQPTDLRQRPITCPHPLYPLQKKGTVFSKAQGEDEIRC